MKTRRFRKIFNWLLIFTLLIGLMPKSVYAENLPTQAGLLKQFNLEVSDNLAESYDVIELLDLMEPTESVEPTDPAKPTDTVESTDSAEPTDSVEPTIPAEPTDPAGMIDLTETTDSVKPSAVGNQTTLVDPAGYVTMSFVDYGIRVEGENVDFPEQLGVIIPPTQVPFNQGENIAQVTIRLLEMRNMSYNSTGTPESGFYLSNIQNFENNVYGYVDSFGEFDSGVYSGWMISQNNWFINMGTSEFQVEDGDIIKWQNTCQLGADIGCDWSNPSAEITGISFYENYGTLTPAFSEEVEQYTLTVPSTINEIRLEALQENYWAILTYKVGEVSYKPFQPIPVEDGTKIDLYCAFSEYYGNPPVDEDRITITIQKESPITEPVDEPVKETEGLKDLLIYTGSTASSMQNTALLGKSNDPGTTRVLFDQRDTTYLINDNDTKLNVAIRFAAVVAEEGSKVILYYGEGFAEKKELATVSSVDNHIGTNWGRVATKAGINEFKLVVTPPSSSLNREITYLFSLRCAPTLNSLSLKSQGRSLYLQPTFSSTTMEYSTDVDDSIKTIKVDTVPKLEEYLLTYNGSVSSEVDVASTDKITIEASSGIGDRQIITNYVIVLNKLQTYQAEIIVNTSSANAVLYDELGNRMNANSDGIYDGLLPNKTYRYVVTAYGYISQSGVITGPNDLDNAKLNIVLKEAPEAKVPLPNYTGEWINFRNSDDNMGITNAKTPISENTANLKWAVKYGTGWSAAPTPPIIVNNFLYIAINKNIVKLEKDTGKQVAISPDMAGNVGFALNPITYAEGILFVPVGLGRIQALRADTLELLWVSEPIGGQTLCPVTYHDGYVYSGTWNSELKVGTYFALSITDEDPTKSNETKLCSWKLDHTGGFYWAGSYVTDNYLIVGSDDGNNEGTYVTTAVLYSVNPRTGQVIDRIQGIKGDIRSTVAYDKDSDRVYFSTKGGWFYSVKVKENGMFEQESIKYLETGGMSTGTPLIYNGRAYLGVSGTAQFSPQGHSYKVIDVETMKEIYSVNIPGYVQSSALLSSAYAETTGKVYVYVTYNYLPGGIYVIEDSAGQTEPKGYHLFVPTGNLSQYCICSLVCDSDGTIYYKNDSCYLMAIENCVFKAKIHLNGGTSDYFTEGQSYGFQESQLGDSLPVPVKENMVFSGWYSNQDFSSEKYDVIDDRLSAVSDLYAKWITKIEHVTNLINEISDTVTLEDKEKVEKARLAYEQLTKEEKVEIKNYEKLQIAEETIKELSKIKVEFIELNRSKLTITEGEVFLLVAKIIPENAENKEITWGTSNENIAAIDATGQINAKKAGEAIITVTSVEGNISATCEVTVVKNVVTPTITPSPVVTPTVTPSPVVTPTVTPLPVVTPTITPPFVTTPPVVNTPSTTVGNSKDKKIYKVEELTVKETQYEQIVLSWRSQDSIEGYYLYSYDVIAKTYQLIATVDKDKNSYTLKGLKQGTTYQYSISSFRKNADGVALEGEKSDLLSVTTLVKVPSISKTSSTATQIMIELNKIPDVTGYEIYMATTKAGVYQRVFRFTKGADILQYTKRTLKPDQIYYFKVRAYVFESDSVHYSEYSQIKAVRTKLQTPVISTIKGQKNQLILNWKKVKGISGYEVYISTRPKENYRKVATLKSTNKTTAIIEKLKANNTYYVKIRSYKVTDGKKVYSEFSNYKKVTVK